MEEGFPGPRVEERLLMSAVVQATCPGCKNVLRIPADWLHQAIRCKQCGTVLQAKHPVARPASHTPAPPPRGVRAAPLARPAPTNGSPFGDLSAADSGPSVRRRRRRGGAWWTGPVIAVAVLLLAGVAAALNWSRIKNILEIDPPATPTSPAVAITTPTEKDKGAAAVVQPEKPPKPKETKRPGPTTKPAPLKNPTPATKPAPVKPKPPVPRPNPPVVSNPPRPDPSKPPTPRAGAFPRRALVISIHDYLYANPVRYG
ncbi:MAG TPA: hypothetical protein VFE78_09075, partial [Gemmataceae bacterium]|nr:hypothetical protein [Gemmataceae bacterium]